MRTIIIDPNWKLEHKKGDPFPDHELIKGLRAFMLTNTIYCMTTQQLLDYANHLYEAYREHITNV